MTHSEVLELTALFHSVWGKAHDAPEYDKREWGKLQRLLDKAMCEATGCGCGAYLKHAEKNENCTE